MATKRIQDLENAEELLNDMLIPVAGLNKTQSAQLSQLREFLNKYLVELNNQNFNDITDDGFYQCGGTSQNAPVGQAVTWVVSVVKDGTIIVQTAYSTDATTSGGAYPNTYRRRYNGSSWSDWQLIAGNLDSNIKEYIKNVYPVGSLFFSTASDCPLQSLGIGSWKNIGTSLTLSVNTNVPVKGNGKAIGITNNSISGGFFAGNSGRILCNTSNYNIATSGTNKYFPDQTIGIVPNATNSGIVGTITRTQITVNIFQRTA